MRSAFEQVRANSGAVNITCETYVSKLVGLASMMNKCAGLQGAVDFVQMYAAFISFLQEFEKACATLLHT